MSRNKQNTAEKYLEVLSIIYSDFIKKGYIEDLSLYTQTYGIATSFTQAIRKLQIVEKSIEGRKFIWKGSKPDLLMALNVATKTSEISRSYILKNNPGKISTPSSKSRNLIPIEDFKEKIYNELFDKAIVSASKAIMIMDLAGVDFNSLPEENKIKLMKELSK